MCEGEFESLKAIYAVSPSFVPQPYAWGRCRREDSETYFLLAEFRDVGEQVRNRSASLLMFETFDKRRSYLVPYYLLRLLHATISVMLPVRPSRHVCPRFEIHFQSSYLCPFPRFLYSTFSITIRSLVRYRCFFFHLYLILNFELSFPISQPNLYNLRRI